MANIHSQKKRILRSERERLENRHYTSAVRTYFRRLEAAVAAGDDKLADAEQRELDGISIDYDDWHFNVRPSNTEPLLRLNLEALSEPLMESKRDEVLAVIRS
jgi:phosphomannomutase